MFRSKIHCVKYLSQSRFRVTTRLSRRRTYDSTRVCGRQGWVIPHDISVGDIADQNERPLREALDNALEEHISNLEDLVESCKVARTGIKWSGWIVRIDELFVGTSSWLREGSQVMEMSTSESLCPVRIDVLLKRVSFTFDLLWDAIIVSRNTFMFIHAWKSCTKVLFNPNFGSQIFVIRRMSSMSETMVTPLFGTR